jgi:hypothetical protein
MSVTLIFGEWHSIVRYRVRVLLLGQHISGITYEAEGIVEKTKLEGLPICILRLSIRGHCQRIHENNN